MPEDQIAIGLERARLRPFDRPMTPAAGISSEEVKWSPDARYVISGAFTSDNSPTDERERGRS